METTKHLPPSQMKFKSKQYIKGGARALSVGLRACTDAKLTPDETVSVLRELRDELYRMEKDEDFEPPILDRAIVVAIQRASQKHQKGQPALDEATSASGA